MRYHDVGIYEIKLNECKFNIYSTYFSRNMATTLHQRVLIEIIQTQIIRSYYPCTNEPCVQTIFILYKHYIQLLLSFLCLFRSHISKCDA